MPKYCEGTIPELIKIIPDTICWELSFVERALGIPEAEFRLEFVINRKNKDKPKVKGNVAAVVIRANASDLGYLQLDEMRHESGFFPVYDVFGKRSGLVPCLSVLERHRDKGASWHWQLVNESTIRKNLAKAYDKDGPEEETILFSARYMRVGYRPN